MSGRELADWVEYYRLEPFGAYRDNIHAGMIAAQVVNMTPRKKGAKALTAADFMVEDRTEKAKKNVSSAVGMLRTLAKPKPKKEGKKK